MGRAFEYRKARKLKRWGHMARTFTKIGKEIELAVLASGPDPSSNLRLRLLMATAKSESMPKENVERAIKRATEKDKSAYKEVVYDGKGPHGTAFVVETATDNPTRTVANIRAAFVRGKGELGTMGMNDFLFANAPSSSPTKKAPIWTNWSLSLSTTTSTKCSATRTKS